MIEYFSDNVPEDIIYIENLVPDSFMKSMYEISMGGDFPWFYADSIVKDVRDHYGFAHTLFLHKENSEYYRFFYPIFYFLENRCNIHISHINRLRLRMTTPVLSDSDYVNIAHIDEENDHMVMVFYINDCDGPTVLYDKKFGDDTSDIKEIARVHPKINSAVLFNGLRFHSGASPSSGRRVILNANFIGEIND